MYTLNVTPVSPLEQIVLGGSNSRKSDIWAEDRGVGHNLSPRTPLLSGWKSPQHSTRSKTGEPRIANTLSKACWFWKSPSFCATLFFGIVVCLTAGITIFSMRRYFEKCTTPSLLMITRHAEKPDIGVGLSNSGACRANMLPSLFNGEIFPEPDMLYTFSPTKGRPSRRGVETLLPISKKLNLPISSFKSALYGEMLVDIKANACGKTVLLIWHRNRPNIGALALKFGVETEIVSIDSALYIEDYDAIWMIEYEEQGGKLLTNLTIKSERLGKHPCGKTS